VDNNRGCGLHIQGGDTNAGTTIQLRAYVNQLWGIYDRSFLGNAHISPNASSNHSDQTPGKAATKVWEAAGDVASGGPFRSERLRTSATPGFSPTRRGTSRPAGSASGTWSSEGAWDRTPRVSTCG
jgi:hypothetical protein